MIEGPTAEAVVVDPGAEPRRELRLDTQVGAVAATTNVVDVGFTIEFEGQVQSVPSTAMEFDVTYTVQKVAPDEISYVARYDDLRVGEGLDAALERELEVLGEEMVGLEALVVVDRLGVVQNADAAIASLPGEASSILDEQGGLFSQPLPVEPVGLGAVWEVRTSSAQNGFVFDILNTYRVTELTDEQVTMAVDQSMELAPGLRTVQGMQVDVQRGEMSGEGVLTWRFDQPVAIGNMSAGGEISMRATQGERSASMMMRMRQDFESRLR